MIAFDEETMRDAEVRIDDTILTAKLKDLPTMASSVALFQSNDFIVQVSTFKTLDKRTFYKVTDIAQIMICTEADPNEPGTSQSERKVHFHIKRN